MTNAIASEIDALQRMTTNELLERYAELHGQALFFDRPQVRRAVDRATARALSRSGGMIRITARRSIRRRRKPSAPGQPPSSPTGVLRESIFYAFDPRKRSVAIGPVRLGRRAGDGGSAGTVPALLEGGGAGIVPAVFDDLQAQRRCDESGQGGP